ncbi:MAG: nucleoside-diphosphate kinase [Isosphaeraceae bacterium]
MPRTLIILKPDCVQRRLVGQVLQRFEAKGLQIDALKLVRVSRPLAERHYAEHKERPFFTNLIVLLTSGPVVAGVVAGESAISVVRSMMGKTNGTEAAPGTIRGDFALSTQYNLVHGSDSPESAEREIKLWFTPEELLDYDLAGSQWVAAR